MKEGLNMTRNRQDSLLLVLLGCAIFVFIGVLLERVASSPAAMIDFKAVYYGARCLVEHRDPYQETELLRVYQTAGGEGAATSTDAHRIVDLCVNFPTCLAFIIPFAILPWGPAHVLWMILIAASVILAAFLMWDIGANYSPGVSGLMVCILLAGSEMLLEIGNTAGIAVTFCVIAVWCFLRERFVPLGVLALAISLAIKPHDAGLVWLYFLLAGGPYRKRALQTLVVTVVLALPAILFVWHIAPHWMAEMNSNLQVTSMLGGGNNPGPNVANFSSHGAYLISLQTVFSVFWDSAAFYDPASYLLGGALLVVWLIAVLRSRPSPVKTWLALAAIAALTMLPLYHRQHDTRLLLLTAPACAMLWAEGGAIKWLALIVNLAGALLTGDLTLELLAHFTSPLLASAQGFPGMILTVLLGRPAALILLVIAIFYLWLYVQRAREHSSGDGRNCSGEPGSLDDAPRQALVP